MMLPPLYRYITSGSALQVVAPLLPNKSLAQLAIKCSCPFTRNPKHSHLPDTCSRREES